MRILILSQYFWPETFIINDFSEALVNSGHDVTVLTGKPNYPEGQVYDGFTARGLSKEVFGRFRIPVIRVPIWPRRSGGAVNLVMNYASFVLSCFIFARRELKDADFDLILVFAPSPITSAIPAISLKKYYDAHLAIWVQDLWPESLSATGFIKNQHVLSGVGRIVQAIYRSADTLLVQSRAFIPSVARFVDGKKVVYYPNCMQDPGLEPRELPNLPAETLSKLDAKFCLVFAGNLGTAQSLETLVGAAERLKGNPDICFVLVGSGSRSGWLESQKDKLGLENLLLPGRFPPSAVPYFLDRADGLLVSLNREDIFSQTIPSKVQAYLAAGKPVLASLDGEGAKVIVEAEAGLTSPAEDVDALVANILALYAMPKSERAVLGENARRYFLSNFDMKRQVAAFGDIMKERMNIGGNID